MHGIGNEQDAVAIVGWVRGHRKSGGRPDCVWSEKAPDGWSFVGSGSFRSVWRSPEGVAYKVEHAEGDRWGQSRDEVSKLSFAWGRGPIDGCRLPKFQEYKVGDEVIVAIELIDGELLDNWDGDRDRRGQFYKVVFNAEQLYRLGDLHGENVIIDEDELVAPVDFGG